MDNDTSFIRAALTLTIDAVKCERYALLETDARFAAGFRDRAARARREANQLLDAACQRVWPDGCS